DEGTGVKIVKSMDRGNPLMRLKDDREEKPQVAQLMIHLFDTPEMCLHYARSLADKYIG
ncbi:unnamed protein product, partial [Prorocentrum cordatum]